VNAGLEEVVIVVQPEDVPLYTKLFHDRVPPATYHRLSTAGRKYADELWELGKRVRLVTQDRQEGFGHAVWCAREAIGEHPFLLVLGDHIYKTAAPGGESCASQVLREFQRVGGNLLGLKKSPAEDVPRFGCATGVWLDHDDASATGRHLVTVSQLVEMPTLEEARARLTMPTLGEDEFLTVFGMYVVSPTIFRVLGDQIEHNMRGATGDYPFTSALDTLRREEGLTGLLVQGERHDLGRPEHYFRTLTALHSEFALATATSSAAAARKPAAPGAAGGAGGR